MKFSRPSFTITTVDKMYPQICKALPKYTAIFHGKVSQFSRMKMPFPKFSTQREMICIRRVHTTVSRGCCLNQACMKPRTGYKFPQPAITCFILTLVQINTIWHHMIFAPAVWKVKEGLISNCVRHVYLHTRPLGNVWKTSGLQCVCGNGLSISKTTVFHNHTHTHTHWKLYHTI